MDTTYSLTDADCSLLIAHEMRRCGGCRWCEEDEIMADAADQNEACDFCGHRLADHSPDCGPCLQCMCSGFDSACPECGETTCLCSMFTDFGGEA